jgi:hypothetical protein
MSVGVFAAAGISEVREREERSSEVRTTEVRTHEIRSLRRLGDWNLENFAGEQIRGLVRQIFFTSVARPPRQVVFSSVENETDVRAICRRVGEALTLEVSGNIAVVGGYPRLVPEEEEPQPAPERVTGKGGMSLRQGAARLRGNLWLVPSEVNGGEAVSTASLHSLMSDLRREFEFSIVEAPPAAESNSAAAMAQSADGVILVLSAHHTRRPAARKTKQILEAAQARILGIVLSDRVFPIPERIYRRL